jgi:hypothetical protein
MRWMGKVSLAGVAAILFVSLEMMHPAARGSQYRPVIQGAEVPLEVGEIFGRACQDCHSNQTEWPWYAHVPPMSMLIAKDVEDGRAFMNLSSWQSYSKGRKLGYLASMASAATTGQMPPRRYTMIHGDARLSDSDRQKIANWATEEMRRVVKEK